MKIEMIKVTYTGKVSFHSEGLIYEPKKQYDAPKDLAKRLPALFKVIEEVIEPVEEVIEPVEEVKKVAKRAPKKAPVKA